MNRREGKQRTIALLAAIAILLLVTAITLVMVDIGKAHGESYVPSHHCPTPDPELTPITCGTSISPKLFLPQVTNQGSEQPEPVLTPSAKEVEDRS